MSLRSALLILIPLLSLLFLRTSARTSHVINFRSPSLYPESLSWDPSAEHFVVGSLRHRHLISVSDAAVVETLVSDPSLPPNTSIIGVKVDRRNRRLLAVVHSPSPLPVFNALAAYDLSSPLRPRLFLAHLHDTENEGSDDGPSRPIANDVAVDYDGNAYVTNAAGNFIWKVTPNGEESTVFSRSPLFTSYPIERNKPYSFCGLNGIIFNTKGYLLVTQSNTGKLFKVKLDTGSASNVILNVDLNAADGIAVRKDGIVVVVSQHKAYFIKSDSSWAEGVVFDETALDGSRFPTSVTVGAEDRVYVLYGHVDEAFSGNRERDLFSISEIESEKEKKEESVWVFVLLGLGLAYFCFWRFQMRHLVKNMNKKTA